MNRKFSSALLALSLVAAALPLAASAITIGVSDEVDTTIVSGHLCQSSASQSYDSGVEWSNQSTSKIGSETDNSATIASVTDPAASAGSSTGTFNVTANGTSGTFGHYANESSSESSLSGAQEAQTGIVNTVSTFANP